MEIIVSSSKDAIHRHSHSYMPLTVFCESPIKLIVREYSVSPERYTMINPPIR
ncbi:hypothetical protein ASPCADRAFT_203168, partial [Aspergillus carbonarius ITEM 5010]